MKNNSVFKPFIGKRVSDINSEYKINCFSTVAFYFKNEIQNGCLSAQEMLSWLHKNTVQVDFVDSEVIVIIWFSSNPEISPDKVIINDLIQSNVEYPFGLIMEHAAVIINQTQVFQKASPNDKDRFEIIDYLKLLENYKSQAWVRMTYHRYNQL